MPSNGDIISFADHARRSLAAARDAGDDIKAAHLEAAATHGETVAPVTAAESKPTDIQFPLRSIPKWVPADS